MTQIPISQKFSIFFLMGVLILSNLTILVQAEELECDTLEECQSLLNQYEKEISQYESNIERSQQDQRTLNNKIYLLKQKISKLELEIKQSNIIIGDLEYQIGDTQESIEKTGQNVEQSKEKLSQVLREIYEQDQVSSLEILLAGNEISDFFENIVALEQLLARNQDILQDIKKLKTDLEQQETTLSQEKTDWEKMKQIQILQKQQSQQVKQEQEGILYETKGEEEEYQKLLAESKAQAQKIRSRIFDLIGVPEAPTFGQAVEIAKYIENLTGVRPAFLLAVLTQESNIGRNVGQCYLKNPNTGSGIGVNSGITLERVMKPERDVPHFLIICKETNRDPYNTLVSCPMSFGWGGAMGPAQFIPSTWVLYKDRVSSIAGGPADPWDIKDAFLAAGLLLRDAGAANQTYNAEWRAAMVYFSGSTDSRYSFYGDSVMSIAIGYEEDIAQLEKFAQK